MKYKMSNEVRFVITDFGFVNPEFNNYVRYYSFIKMFSKYWTSQECKDLFQVNLINVVCPNDFHSSNNDFQVIFYNSQVEDIEDLFKKHFSNAMFDLKVMAVIEEEKQFEIDHKKMETKEQDIKDLKHIRWSIPEKDLPEKIQNSENWLEERFHEGKICLNLKNCVGEWLYDIGVELCLVNPTWKELLFKINNAFAKFIEENGELDHIFLENIQEYDNKDGIAYFKITFGS